jgi:hypothetical protein
VASDARLDNMGDVDFRLHLNSVALHRFKEGQGLNGVPGVVTGFQGDGKEL